MSRLNLKSIRQLKTILKIDNSSPDEVSEAVNIPATSKFAGKVLLKTLLLATAVLMAWGVFSHLPVTFQDWHHSFRPAALQWQDPYYREGIIFNPPWIFPVLYPLALLPSRAGAGLLIIISVIAVMMYTGSAKKTLIVAASAPIPALIALGQFDALLLFGLMLPYGLGIPVLLTKPQAVFLTILPRLNRWSILLTLLIFVLSIFIWGDWWTNIIGNRPNLRANMSLFPYTIILGIPLGYWGYKRKSDALLCGASLCFAPYFMTHSMLPMVAAIIRETDDWRWWSVVVLGSWLYVAAMKGFFW